MILFTILSGQKSIRIPFSGPEGYALSSCVPFRPLRKTPTFGLLPTSGILLRPPRLQIGSSPLLLFPCPWLSGPASVFGSSQAHLPWWRELPFYGRGVDLCKFFYKYMITCTYLFEFTRTSRFMLIYRTIYVCKVFLYIYKRLVTHLITVESFKHFSSAWAVERRQS